MIVYPAGGVVVFTAILGGSDSLKPAPAGADCCVCFVDDPAAFTDRHGWQLVRHDYAGDPRREAWRIRCIAHQFEEADRTVWIDASFTLTDLPRLLKDAGTAPIAALRHHERRTCYEEGRAIVKAKQATKADVEPQLRAYQRAGFDPHHLSISCIIVRDNSAAVQKFNQCWDEEIRRYPGDNTQISLDYAAWKAGLTIKALRGVRKNNPYSVHDHRDHKRRRKPYATEVAA